MQKMSRKQLLLGIIGLIFCTVPPLLAILLYFPLWREMGGSAVLSGFSLLLILLSIAPLLKTLKRLLRSPAVYTVWLIAFLIFLVISKIAEQMTVICFVGFVGNAIGAVFFSIAKRIGRNGRTNP